MFIMNIIIIIIDYCTAMIRSYGIDNRVHSKYNIRIVKT